MSHDISNPENNSPEPNGWKLLTNVSNEIEYQMVTGLLKEAEIQSVSKVGDMDAFLQVFTGIPLSGIDVLVPDDRFDEAYALINTPFDENELLKQEMETEK